MGNWLKIFMIFSAAKRMTVKKNKTVPPIRCSLQLPAILSTAVFARWTLHTGSLLKPLKPPASLDCSCFHLMRFQPFFLMALKHVFPLSTLPNSLAEEQGEARLWPCRSYKLASSWKLQSPWILQDHSNVSASVSSDSSHRQDMCWGQAGPGTETQAAWTKSYLSDTVIK